MNPENRSTRLKKLSKDDREKLFAFIPRIESIKEFSRGGELIEDPDDPEAFIVTPEIEDPIVFDFMDTLEELDLIIPFSWPEWERGKEILEKGDFENLDTETLLKILTVLIRKDHFSYGSFLASKFEDGTIKKILIGLKKNIQEE